MAFVEKAGFGSLRPLEEADSSQEESKYSSNSGKDANSVFSLSQPSENKNVEKASGGNVEQLLEIVEELVDLREVNRSQNSSNRGE